MKNILTIILLLTSALSFSQNNEGLIVKSKPNYSGNSKIKVVYNDSLNKSHSNKKPVGIFVNGEFIGNENTLSFINSDKIENLKVEKENYEINGIEYYGKILVKIKSDYNPDFLTLKNLSIKYYACPYVSLKFCIFLTQN